MLQAPPPHSQLDTSAVYDWLSAANLWGQIGVKIKL